MKTKIFILASALVAMALASCDTDVKRLEVQKLKTYDEQYYKNLRDFHKSDHEVSFAYYEGWSPVEGVEGYKDPASWGERMIGLPDSIDIVNLWMGVPSNDPEDGSNGYNGCTYAPIAYADMKECQTKKGIRFIMHADASNYNHKFTVDGVDYDMSAEGSNVSDETMAAYAKWIANTVDKPGLDGVDIDYEGWSANNLVRLVKELSNYMGPKSQHPEKLLIVDYFGSVPPSELSDYCDYFVQQAYSNQTSARFPGSLPNEKMIFCETFGVFYADGGRLLDYARMEPSTGRKGGCGVFFLGRNYYSSSGVPYNEFRQAIQIMNPALNY